MNDASYGSPLGEEISIFRYLPLILLPIPVTSANAQGAPQVCKAAIAVIMARDAATVQVSKTDGEVSYLKYRRPNDGTVWSYRCKLEGDKVIWASDPGRWRTDAADETILFAVDPKGIAIIQRFSDGSQSKEVVPSSKLR